MRRCLLLLVAALALALPLQQCAAHICLFSPVQRGEMVLDDPGHPSCAHKGPAVCGGVAPGKPTASYVAGLPATVQFQQNLNHFYGKAPGHLAIVIAKGSNPSPADFTYTFGSIVPDWNAMDEISWANITVRGVMPPFACDACTLRLAYHSDNPYENDTSTDFFQCADITITESKGAASDDSDSDNAFPLPTPVKTAAVGDNSGCCTEPQWESQFLSAGGADGGGYGGVSYDAKTRLMFVAQSLDADDSYEAHFINFTSGYEWRFVQDGQGKITCDLFGADDWNDWCYGPSQNTVSAGSISLAGTDVSVWFHAQAEFSWGVAQSRGQCLPVFRQHSPVNQLQVYFNYTSGIADPAVFNPPPECHRSHVQAWKVAQGSDLKAVRALAASLPRSRRAGGIKAAQAASAAASAAAAAASSTPKRHHRHSSNAALAAALAEPLQRINKRTQQKQQGGH